MPWTIVLLGLPLLAAAMLVTPRSGAAEPFLDLYGGVSHTETVGVTAAHRDCGVGFFFAFCGPESKATRDAEFDYTATYGLRGGYWLQPVPWLGFAGDVSTFTAEADNVRFRLIPFSVLILGRLPLLASPDIPNGRLQPYVGVGPTIFYQEATVDFRPELERKIVVDSLEVGFDVRAGLTWQFHPRVGVFAEYRFSYLPVAVDVDSDFGPPEERVDARLRTHHVLFGVSIRF